MSENHSSEQRSTATPIESTQIETDGGAVVGGNVNTGGDFIGRDRR